MADSTSRRVHVLVSGRVQGVSFRHFTEDRAQALGVAGWVRNLPDGRVELVAEGPPAAVQGLLGFVRRGPPLARVDGCAVVEQAPAGDLTGFESRPTPR